MGIGTPGSGGGMQAAPAGRCWGMGTRVLEFPMILFSAGNGNAGWQRDGVRDRALGGGAAGKGLRAHLTCKVQLPQKLGCLLKSSINTQTQLHAHMRRGLSSPRMGV